MSDRVKPSFVILTSGHDADVLAAIAAVAVIAITFHSTDVLLLLHL